MSIKAVLFDLDGTLLPMDQDHFTSSYFKHLCKKLAPYGYEPETLVKSVWAGTKAMALNDGTKTNEQAFWDRFAEIYGEKVLEHKPLFEEFYREDFRKAKDFCGFDPLAAKAVKAVKDAGCKAVLATNPIFPETATKLRIDWAGLDENDFEFYTVYETSKFSKPNPEYYRGIINRLGVLPQECLMVGNDVAEDMAASELGINVFLITACVINKNGEDLSKFPAGDFNDFITYFKQNKD